MRHFLWQGLPERVYRFQLFRLSRCEVVEQIQIQPVFHTYGFRRPRGQDRWISGPIENIIAEGRLGPLQSLLEG